MKVKQFSATLKPSLLMRRMIKHKGDVSEGTTSKIVAVRHILGHRIDFYYNGMRIIHGLDLTEEEMYNSEILRFAHASLLTGEAVGDKRRCYVDATINPVEVWVYNTPIKSFVSDSTSFLETM